MIGDEKFSDVQATYYEYIPLFTKWKHNMLLFAPQPIFNLKMFFPESMLLPLYHGDIIVYASIENYQNINLYYFPHIIYACQP